MEIRDIKALSEPINILDVEANLISFEALSSGQHVVQIMGNGWEIANMALTRGEAMLELGEYFDALGKELKKRAFEQEGAVRIRDARNPR